MYHCLSCHLICISLKTTAEKAMAPHSSTLAWKIPWTEEPGGLQSMGSRRVGHNWETSLSLFIFLHWRRNGNPPQCSCLRIPGTAEPGGLPSMGSHRVGHNWSDLAVAKTTDVEHLLIYLLAFHTSIYVLYPFFNWVVFVLSNKISIYSVVLGKLNRFM